MEKERKKLELAVGDCFLDCNCIIDWSRDCGQGKCSTYIYRVVKIYEDSVVCELGHVYPACTYIDSIVKECFEFWNMKRISIDVYNAFLTQIKDHLAKTEELRKEYNGEVTDMLRTVEGRDSFPPLLLSLFY